MSAQVARLSFAALVVVLILTSSLPFAYAQLKPVIVNGPVEFSIGIDTNGESVPKSPHTEVVPSVIGGGWLGLFLTTDTTFFCAFGLGAGTDSWIKNPLFQEGHRTYLFKGNNGSALPATSCQNLSQPLSFDRTSIDSHTEQWRRNYSGVFGGVVQDSSLFTISHGENKNEAFRVQDPITGSISYVGLKNSVNPSGLCPWGECWSGWYQGTYIERWEAYHGFVFMDKYSWLSGFARDGTLGPIVWPSQGYVYRDPSTGRSHQASMGVRHPTSFAYGDHLYVFYQDKSLFNEPGRQDGIKVARARRDQLATPGAFRALYNRKFSQPAIPTGLDLRKRGDFDAALFTRGPLADRMFASDDNRLEGIERMAVTALADQPYFMAVLSTSPNDGSNPGIYLSFSKNLLDWSKPRLVLSGSSYTDFRMHYALPLSDDGQSNERVDSRSFYLIGVDSRGKLNRMKMSLEP